MSKIDNQSKSLYNIQALEDLDPESAASYSGGAVTVTDVSLFSNPNSNSGDQFNTNKAIENLADFGFNDATGFIAVNNGQTWRFYENANFKGKFIDVGPDEARSAGKFGMKISSLKAIT